MVLAGTAVAALGSGPTPVLPKAFVTLSALRLATNNVNPSWTGFHRVQIVALPVDDIAETIIES
jgi:hypothetical protein